MHLKWLLVILSLLLCLLDISLTYEIKKSFDNEQNYPASKASFYNRSKQHQHPSQRKVIKVKSGKLKFKKFKREQTDNVKGDLKPQSREDIYNIKRLSFHGRNSPNAQPLISENRTYYNPQIPQTITTTEKLYHSEPIQRNDYYIPRSQKNSNPPKKSTPPSVDNQVTVSKQRYVPHSEKFYPLMRPSPINVMPTEPPSFDTVRNYVRYLKMRQQKFFSDFDNDDFEEKPTPVVAALAQPKISVPYGGEIDYFKEREKELVREEERRNQFSPSDFGSNDRAGEIDEDLQPYKDDAYESEITNSNNNNEDRYRSHEDEENSNLDSFGGELQEYYENSREDYDDAVAEDETRQNENFVPFKLYAQVRHMEADHHDSPKKSKKNVKEKVSLAKKNVYYKEEGYEDKNYDHGADKLNYGYDESIKDFTPNYAHTRSKRSVASDDNNESFDISKLPVALAYIKKSELPKLTGAKLLNHLDELLKNSSIYLPDDDDSLRPIKITKPKRTKKYPYYNFPDTVLSEMSAHRYSENLKNYPRHKESLYKQKNIRLCEEIEDNINPVPSDIEEEGKSTKFNNKPKRLRGLGDKIECLREKYFGKDPFDNPLFHEDDNDEYIAATIPIPVNHNLSRQANPLITVYDDVINNIRTGFLDEFKKKREAEDALKAASEQITIKAEQTKIPNLSAVTTIGNNFPLFDINNFIPKFKGTINYDLIDDIDELNNAKLEEEGSAAAELQKINKQQLLLETKKFGNSNHRNSNNKEKSKVKRNNKIANSDLIEDIAPPLPPKSFPSNVRNAQVHKTINSPSSHLTIQKFRRFVPNTIAYPAKHISSIYLSQKPSSQTTYRFKLL